MRIKSHYQPIQEGDMTPFIDMTFQLICFFMVLLNFTDTETNDKIQLPDSSLARPPDAPLETPIVIHLTAEGNTIMGGQEQTIAGSRPMLNAERTELQQQKKSAADANIIIRGHKNVRVGDVQELIKLCQECQFEKFTLRVNEEKK